MFHFSVMGTHAAFAYSLLFITAVCLRFTALGKDVPFVCGHL